MERIGAAWIENSGEHGNNSRRFILDPVMKPLLAARTYKGALDVGCGEGRFCRIMQEHGIETVGIDRTVPLLEQARKRDPKGDYREGVADKLDFADGRFDLDRTRHACAVVSRYGMAQELSKSKLERSIGAKLHTIVFAVNQM